MSKLFNLTTVAGGAAIGMIVAGILALVGGTRITILDELTTGLDPAARRETWALIEAVRARGVTILLVTHHMDEAERLCDRIMMIAGGRVAATGTADEVAAAVGEPTLEDAVVALTLRARSVA